MLKHYGFYLNEEVDREMMEFLEPYVKTRRIGELVRRLVSERMCQPIQPAPAPSYERPAIMPVQALVYQGPPSANDVVAKAKRAFFK